MSLNHGPVLHQKTILYLKKLTTKFNQNFTEKFKRYILVGFHVQDAGHYFFFDYLMLNLLLVLGILNINARKIVFMTVSLEDI